jgi:hypothetical protein
MYVVGSIDHVGVILYISLGTRQSVGNLATILIFAPCLCVHSNHVTHVSDVAVFHVYAKMDPSMYPFHAVGIAVVSVVLIVVAPVVIDASWSVSGV